MERKTEKKIKSKYQLLIVFFVIVLLFCSYPADFRNQVLKTPKLLLSMKTSRSLIFGRSCFKFVTIECLLLQLFDNITGLYGTYRRHIELFDCH